MSEQNISGTAVGMDLSKSSPVLAQSPSKFYLLRRLFMVGCSLILLATASAKMVTLFSKPAILSFADPVLGMFTQAQSMIAAVALEIIALLLMLYTRSARSAVNIVLWLSGVFLVYRIGYYFSPERGRRFCPCLGTITAGLPLSPETLQQTANVLFLYMLVGSVAFWIFQRFVIVGEKNTK